MNRDSGSRRNGENSRSEVEGVARQNGAESASPNPCGNTRLSPEGEVERLTGEVRNLIYGLQYWNREAFVNFNGCKDELPGWAGRCYVSAVERIDRAHMLLIELDRAALTSSTPSRLELSDEAKRVLGDYPYVDRTERFTGKSAAEHAQPIPGEQPSREKGE